MTSPGVVTRDVARGVTRSLNDIGGKGGHHPALELLYQFTSNESLAPVDGLGPTLTCTRAGATATRATREGLMEVNIPADTPRFDWNPVTGEFLGLLVEEERENIALYSGDISNAVWVASNMTKETTEATDTTGALNSNIRITAAAANATLMQTVTSAVDSYTYSCLMRAVTVTGNVEITVDGGTTWTAKFCPNFWIRHFVTTASETNPQFGVRLVNSGDSIDFWGSELNRGVEYPTTHIPTVASPVTRNADVISTTDVGWLNASAGSFAATSLLSHFTGTLGVVLDLSDNSATDRIYIQRSAAEGPGNLVIAASSTEAALATGSYSENVIARQASCYASNDVEFYVDGTRAGTGDQLVTLPTGLNQLVIGNNFQGTQAFNGWIREIRYYNERLANPVLESMSNGVFP